MEVYQLNSSLYDANAYLVAAPRTVLVDVGMNASYVLEKVRDLLGHSNIDLVILTHGHYDHWGAVEEVRRQTGAIVALHEDDAVLLDDDVSSVSAMFGARRGGFKPDRLLASGEVLDLGDGTGLEVIHTPGHTPGSICLYHPDTGALFSGDTVFPGGSFGRTDLTGGSQEQLVGSLERLSEMDAGVMYPGHGEVTGDDVPGQIRMSLHMAGAYL